MKPGKKLRGWRAVREVVVAVYQLNDDQGSKKHDIRRYIRHNTHFRSFNCKRALQGALKTGLIKMKNGRFFPVSQETLFTRHRHRGALNTKGNVGGEKTVKRGQSSSPRLSHSRRNSIWNRKKGILNSNKLGGKSIRRSARKSKGRRLKYNKNNERHCKNCKKACLISSSNHFDGKSFPLSYFS